jgi:hypothetical protein
MFSNKSNLSNFTMTNKTKLILANLFALISVVLIYAGSSKWGIDLSFGSGNILPQIFLLLIPQLGFLYLYLNLPKLRKKRVTA